MSKKESYEAKAEELLSMYLPQTRYRKSRYWSLSISWWRRELMLCCRKGTD